MVPIAGKKSLARSGGTVIVALATAAALILAPAFASSAQEKPKPDKEGWYSLFDGKTLNGWKAGEHPESFRVENGVIVVNGLRSHLFYVGPVLNHNFKNFHFKAKVKTYPKANSGIYFHTKYQAKGWPSIGYEAQVDNSHADWRRTGSLYGVVDIRKTPAKDGEWFDYEIIVRGKRIILKVNGKTTVDYTEPPDLKRKGRRLSSGTFALQAHDPGSRVEYKDIMVKPLPD